MKMISEKAMMPFLADVDNIKMTKVRVCCLSAALDEFVI